MLTEYVIPLPGGKLLIVSADVEAALREVELRQERVAHLRPLLLRIATRMRQDVGEQFAEGGDPHGRH